MSLAPASRMPATPRITVRGSPTTVPPSASASSASVREIMGVEASMLPGTLDQLLEHVAGQVHALVDVDDESSGAVEHEVQSLAAGHLLDGGADLVHHVVGGRLVGLRRLAVGSPGVLDEGLVLADRLLELQIPLLALARGEDRALVLHVLAELRDLALLLGRLVAPPLHLPVETRLGVHGLLVLCEDPGRVNIADPDVRRRDPEPPGQRERHDHRERQRARRHAGPATGTGATKARS